MLYQEHDWRCLYMHTLAHFLLHTIQKADNFPQHLDCKFLVDISLANAATVLYCHGFHLLPNSIRLLQNP